MQKWLVCICLIWLSKTGFSQDTLNIIPWEQAVKMPVDSVFAIDASHQKWDSLPSELYRFTQLKYLDISKNKLVELPNELRAFQQLRVLDASRNKLSGAPVAVCQLSHLKRLHIGRNNYSSLPACIGYLTELAVLDIWDNPIGSLPEELLKLTHLKKVDMQGIMLSPSFQDRWVKAMPNVKWYFDAPCHCVE